MPMLVVNVKDGTRYFGGAHFVQGWLAHVKIVSSRNSVLAVGCAALC